MMVIHCETGAHCPAAERPAMGCRGLLSPRRCAVARCAWRHSRTAEMMAVAGRDAGMCRLVHDQLGKPGERMTYSPSTLWLTGLSAAGKTTLAQALADALATAGVACQILDGDVVQQQLSRDLGFSRKDRSENIRRV